LASVVAVAVPTLHLPVTVAPAIAKPVAAVPVTVRLVDVGVPGDPASPLPPPPQTAKAATSTVRPMPDAER